MVQTTREPLGAVHRYNAPVRTVFPLAQDQRRMVQLRLSVASLFCALTVCCRTSTLHGRILSLKQDPLHLHYRVTWPDSLPFPLAPPASTRTEVQREDDTEDLLRHYFSLSLDLVALYEQWSRADPNFRKRAPAFTGVRILSQDTWEALLCFICSSNNNINRISQMVRMSPREAPSIPDHVQAHKLCKNYGPLIGHVGDEALHDFPTPDSLIGEHVEPHLRELGFGYRAKYIAQTARIVALEKPALWLESLRNPEHPESRDCQVSGGSRATYKDAHEALLSLAGVGPKVADCVCLMGLGWGESVPVDTHVWQIAQRDYKFGRSKTKTFNKVLYDAVGDHFRDVWGKYAGWAHSVLFAAHLREFSDRSVKKEDAEPLQTHMNEGQAVDGTRKRMTAAKEVKTEVKVEETEHGTVAEVERAMKRRRTTRQRP